jgi:hypothetical protein
MAIRTECVNSNKEISMRLRSIVAALAFGMLAVGGVAQAASVEVEIGVAPPPDREVIIAPARPGFIYERPHYGWDGRTYVWTDGRFIEERRGHAYVQPMIEHRGEHWYFRSGHWDDD